MKNIYQTPSESCDVIELQNFWGKVIDNQIASGIGAEKFCQQQQLNFSQFHYWKYRKIKSNFSHGDTSNKPKNRQHDEGAAKFISVQVTADVLSNEQHKEGAVDVQNEKVEIIFKNGHKIVLPLVVSETNLLLLIKIVGGLQC